MDDLGKRLAATLGTLLSLRQMEQGTLAEKAGMAPSQVSDYLNGVTLPQLPQLERIAHALDIDLLTIFFVYSRIEEVQQRIAALEEQPDELGDKAGDVFLLREGGLLIKHPLTEVADALNRLNHYITDLQLALGIRRKDRKPS
jgi:transcriptional regulator with XRE-family HTH domain